MSMPPQLAGVMRYFQVRVRTHEWAERQRVSLLDVPHLNKHHLRMLYAAELSTADRIMATPVPSLVDRLSSAEQFPRDRAAAETLVRGWREHLIRLWRQKTDDAPLPDIWIHE